MPNYQKTANFSRWVTRFFMLVLFVALFLMPAFTRWYVKLRVMEAQAGTIILAAFYVCAIPSAIALALIHKLLSNICRGVVFENANARYVRCISLCCAAVSMVTAVAGVVYPPLFFITVIMLFLCLLVSVVSNVLSAAAAMREENDLTI